MRASRASPKTVLRHVSSTALAAPKSHPGKQFKKLTGTTVSYSANAPKNSHAEKTPTLHCSQKEFQQHAPTEPTDTTQHTTTHTSCHTPHSLHTHTHSG